MITPLLFKVYFAPLYGTASPPRTMTLYRDYALTYNVFMDALMNEVKVMESTNGKGFVMQCRLPNAELMAEFEVSKGSSGDVSIKFSTNKKAFDAFWRKDDSDLCCSLGLQ
jgi:hypothetical protein